MPDDKLPPKPEPQIEPGEPNPGGADAIDGVDGETAEHEPTGRDLHPDDNPAVEDALPDEMKQSEDTSTEATEATKDGDASDDDKDVEPEEESPA